MNNGPVIKLMCVCVCVCIYIYIYIYIYIKYYINLLLGIDKVKYR